MKAAAYNQYGPPEQVLKIRDLEKPEPKANEVMIKTHATTINDYDWSMVSGKPTLYRLIFGLFKPKYRIPGMELSGVVEKAGESVTKFKPGDEVFGDISDYGFGTFAEYISVPENAVVGKPADMPFEEAAALPHASLLALQALRDLGDIQQGQKILINGAGGGVGTLGLQIAKTYGCEVTGVDSGEKLEMMTVAGFDHVIDYKKENFTRNGLHYDLILDCKSGQSAFAYARSLNPNGKYVTVGGKTGSLFNILFWGKMISIFSKKTFHLLALKPNAGIDTIIDFYSQNKIKSVVDGPYSMEEIPRLVQYFGEGRHKGKIVVKIN